MKKIILAFLLVGAAGCAKKEEPIDAQKPSIDLTNAGMYKWQTYQEKNPMDDSMTVLISLDAEDQLEFKKPILALRCLENKFDIFFVLDNIAEHVPKDYKTSLVKMRFDNDQAKDYSMRISDAMEILFFKEPLTDLNALLTHNKLTVQYNMVGGKHPISTFDLKGLSSAIEPVIQTCGIKVKNFSQKLKAYSDSETEKVLSTVDANEDKWFDEKYNELKSSNQSK